MKPVEYETIHPMRHFDIKLKPKGVQIKELWFLQVATRINVTVQTHLWYFGYISQTTNPIELKLVAYESRLTELSIKS